MADKLQLKTVFNSVSGKSTKTITLGDTDSADDDIKSFAAALGTFVSAYSLTSNSKIETTSLDD